MPLPENDAQILLLHNARCSKSRTAEVLLGERDIAFEVRSYLESPLTRAELDDLRQRLDLPVREWTRTSEAAFHDAGLADSASESDWLDALAEHPILMQRPIVIRGLRALIARPPTRVCELFDE